MADELEELTKEELQEKLADAGEPVSGNKSELIDRLKAVADEGKPTTTKLVRDFPETADSAWVKGNPEQAKAMGA
jgi:hypothetical protein